MARRIIRLDDGVPTVAVEARFDTEADLHRVIAEHPEVLPTEDLRMGPLVALANELDLGAGPMDLLAVDFSGRLVVVEFKRGSENPDVRKVVAQVLDYGSRLWRHTYAELEDRCRSRPPGFTETLADHVKSRLEALGEDFDPDLFQTGMESCLDAGNFVFLYVGRDLDERTRRIMTFFAVEVDLFRDTRNTSVVVPRTAFVPSWVTGPDVANRRAGVAAYDPTDGPADVAELIQRMDDVAVELNLRVKQTRSGRNYHPAVPEQGLSYSMGVGVYGTTRRIEFNLLALRERGKDALADQLLAELRDISGLPLKGLMWPAVPCRIVANNWERARRAVIEPYFEARGGGKA
jgi:hypothetical protein